jgi:hypothetical protein
MAQKQSVTPTASSLFANRFANAIPAADQSNWASTGQPTTLVGKPLSRKYLAVASGTSSIDAITSIVDLSRSLSCSKRTNGA